MTTRTPHAATMLVSTFMLTAALSAAACGDSSPTTPTTTPPTPTPTMLAVFADPGSSFSTSDVRDAQDRIVRFDTPSNSLVWSADGRMFTGYPVMDTYYVRADKFFQIRFGSQNGEKRAYFTEAGRGTLCAVQVVGSALVITATDLPVPSS
jgi:hypothetical protein